MKTAVAIVIALIVLAGGGYVLAKHNNKTKSISTGTAQNMSTAMSSGQSTSSVTKTSANSVTISNFAFSPANIAVKVGDTVTWTNKDSVGHTVTKTDSQTGPASSTLDNGKTYSFTYKTAGTFKYHCSIHPDMVGMVTVTN